MKKNTKKSKSKKNKKRIKKIKNLIESKKSKPIDYIQNNLKDFKLAKAKEYPVEILMKLDDKDSLGSFICSLSMAYNNLKDLTYFARIVDNNISHLKKQDCKIIEEHGQLAGQNWFINKNFIGLVHELFVLIEKSYEIINSKEFKAVLERIKVDNCLKAEVINEWNSLVRYSSIKSKDSVSIKDQKNILSKIRSNISFHYNQTKVLIPAYKSQVLKRPSYNKFLYSSEGTDMESTRYYFADAITQGYIQDNFERINTDFTNLSSLYTKIINRPLKLIIESYLNIQLQEHNKTK